MMATSAATLAARRGLHQRLKSRNLATASVQILRREDGPAPKFVLDDASLRSVLCDPVVADKPACILTVAGAMRTGKSFLLNQMLNQLSKEEEGGAGGFPWRGGMERFTSGIHFSQQPVLVKDKDGNDLVVYLMDTQGTFDHRTTVRENMTIFALSTMMSSVLMYNLMHVIREDHLQHLQLFTEYGRLALKSTGTVPFQKLQFLVRDWHYPMDAPFGKEGGQLVLQRLLKTSEDQPVEVNKLRGHISSCFSDIDCFLLPYPGAKVAEDPTFDGKSEDMDQRFRIHLEKFVGNMLHVDNLAPKVIAGKVVKSKELVDYFNKYLEIFNGDEIPEPKSIFESTAEVNNLHAMNDAKGLYIERMDLLKKAADTKAIVDSELIKNHQQISEEAIRLFDLNSKFGGDVYAMHFHDQLLQAINEKFIHYQNLNDAKIKNLFYKAKDSYISQMESYCKREEPFDQQEIVEYHLKFAKEAFRSFHTKDSFGSLAYSQELKEQLVKEIDERFVYYQNLNDSKIRNAIHEAQSNALGHYKNLMEKVLEGPLSIDDVELKYQHRDAKKEAMDVYVGCGSFGSDLFKVKKNSLENDISDKYAYFRELNSSKQLTKRLKATVLHLSDNETYKQFWNNPQQQKIAGGTVITLVAVKVLFGS